MAKRTRRDDSLDPVQMGKFLAEAVTFVSDRIRERELCPACAVGCLFELMENLRDKTGTIKHIEDYTPEERDTSPFTGENQGRFFFVFGDDEFGDDEDEGDEKSRLRKLMMDEPAGSC